MRTRTRLLTGFVGAHLVLSLLLGVIATLAQIVVIYFLAGIVSAPLEKLALKVNRIQQLEGESLPGQDSPIREISVLSRAIDPGKVFDLELPLDEAPEAYAAMDERRAIKVLLRP